MSLLNDSIDGARPGCEVQKGDNVFHYTNNRVSSCTVNGHNIEVVRNDDGSITDLFETLSNDDGVTRYAHRDSKGKLDYNVEEKSNGDVKTYTWKIPYNNRMLDVSTAERTIPTATEILKARIEQAKQGEQVTINDIIYTKIDSNKFTSRRGEVTADILLKALDNNG